MHSAGQTCLQIASFVLDYEAEDGTSRKKKPWRFRWPDDLQSEVLGRLVELNTYRSS